MCRLGNMPLSFRLAVACMQPARGMAVAGAAGGAGAGLYPYVPVNL